MGPIDSYLTDPVAKKPRNSKRLDIKRKPIQVLDFEDPLGHMLSKHLETALSIGNSRHHKCVHEESKNSAG